LRVAVVISEPLSKPLLGFKTVPFSGGSLFSCTINLSKCSGYNASDKI
jgi:hypothetical protein